MYLKENTWKCWQEASYFDRINMTEMVEYDRMNLTENGENDLFWTPNLT